MRKGGGGSTILGRQHFLFGCSAGCVTKVCQQGTSDYHVEEEEQEEAGRMSRRRGWFWTCQVLDHTYPSCWLTERKKLLLLHIRKTLLLKFCNEKFLQMYIMHLLRTACVIFHQQEQRGRGPQTWKRPLTSRRGG